LLQRVGKNMDHFRFILDPVAEYFAGLHLVETECRSDAKRWLDFLKAAAKNDPDKSKGFLLAVRDCCLAAEANVPEGVPDELAKLAGLSIRELEQYQREQRVRRNVANLDLPAAEDRVAAAEALASIGVEAEKAVPVLVNSLRDREWRVRAASAPAKIVPELGRLLKDERRNEVLLVTVETLGEFGAASKEFIPQLCSILHSGDNKHVREASATALGRIGREAKEVIPDLITALSDDDWDVAEKASRALGQIGADAVTDLSRVLTHTDELVRWRAAEALAAIGTPAKDAVPALIHALEDEDWSVRKSAAVALGRIGPAAIDAVDVLQKTKGDEERSVARSAKDALQSIDPEGEAEREAADISGSKNTVS
jgi:HEAT repeat protein